MIAMVQTWLAPCNSAICVDVYVTVNYDRTTLNLRPHPILNFPLICRPITMTHVHTRLRAIARALIPWAIALTGCLQATAQTAAPAPAPETSAVMYPMFFIGNPDTAKHHIEFMWTVSAKP